MAGVGGRFNDPRGGQVQLKAERFEEVVAGHVKTPLTPPNQVNPQITQPTNDAIMIAMAKRPSDRYPTYDDFIMALHAARSQLLVHKFRGHGGGGQAGGKSWWKR